MAPKTATIPTELTRQGELVVLPRKQYEEFVRLSRRILRHPLSESLEDVRAGRVSRSFSSHRALIGALKKRRK